LSFFGFFFYDSSIHLEVLNASCSDYSIGLSFLLLLVIEKDWMTSFSLFFANPDLFEFVGDFKLFIDGVLLRVRFGI
jgi:hypothetical protein